MPWEEQREYVMRALESHDKRLEVYIERNLAHCEREEKAIDALHDRMRELEGTVAMLQQDTQAKFDLQRSEFKQIKLYAAFGGALTALVTIAGLLIAHYLGVPLPGGR